MDPRDASPETASTTPGGARALLPADWDPRLDLVVACGRGAPELLAGLPAGSRALAFLPPEAQAEPGPRSCPVVRGPAELVRWLVALRGPSLRRVKVVSSGDPWAAPERLREVAAVVERGAVSRQLQRNTLALTGPLWLDQALENLGRIAARPSIDALAGAFAGKPAVLVSPGPSLSRNVAQLASLRGRALVVTGTHGLALLRRHGVRPDVVVAADAGDLLRHWEGVDPREVGALAVGASCRAALYDLPTPHQFVFQSSGDVEGWIFEALGETAYLATGGSVACSALSLARALGCDPIALVGQDLAFSEGRYYAEGGLDAEAAVEHNQDGTFYLRKPGASEGPGAPQADGSVRFTRDQKLREVPGYGGGTVRTSETLRAFLTWFESMAELAGERTLLNCTEGGARIAGFNEVPLARASEGWAAGALDADAVFARASAGLDARARAQRLLRLVERLQADLEPCLRAARRCVERCRPERVGELAPAEAELKRRLKPLRLLSTYAQRETEAARTAAARASSLAENLTAARGLFEAVLAGGERLAAGLRRARAGLPQAPATA